MFCDMCGNELSQGAAFCWNCGSAISKTQNFDAYDLSQFAHPTPSPMPPTKERVMQVIASLEQFNQALRATQDMSRKNGDAVNKQLGSSQTLNTSLTALSGIFTGLERMHAMQGAPTEEMRLSIELMLLTLQHYELAIQHFASASQELDGASDTLIQAQEMMINWLKNQV
jgi:hypothetical protein